MTLLFIIGMLTGLNNYNMWDQNFTSDHLTLIANVWKKCSFIKPVET